MVHEPAGRGNKDVHPLSEGLFLGRGRDASIDGSSREGRVQGEVTKMIRDLYGKLSCGDKDKGPRFSPGLPDQPVENWKKEGGGLTASCHGRGHDIAALEKGWDGQFLDRCRLVKPLFLEGFQQMGMKQKR
jgi:hypothetical protein